MSNTFQDIVLTIRSGHTDRLTHRLAKKQKTENRKHNASGNTTFGGGTKTKLLRLMQIIAFFWQFLLTKVTFSKSRILSNCDKKGHRMYV